MPPLLLEHLLQVADFPLHLPACFFCRPTIAQVWIPCCLAAFSFTLPFASLNPPLILSFVLDFIRTKSREMNMAVVNTQPDHRTVEPSGESYSSM
jgi:hypothetical protein